MEWNTMLNIKDRIIGYNTSEASLYLDDDYHQPEANNDRFINMRDKFIKSVYQMLKSDEFKDFYLKYDEQIDAQISIKHDAIEISY